MTPVFMTDSKGDVVWTMTGGPFNQNQLNTDPDDDGEEVNNPFRFPGQYADSETDNILSYNWNRYYIPQLGRYNRVDPMDDIYLYISA